MKIELAEKYGFCFGVKRAIKMAQNSYGASTIGELIHNSKEIDRLKEEYNVKTLKDIDELSDEKKVIIRTHGITKEKLKYLEEKKDLEIINATCPFVTKPQQIVENMSKENYEIIIFGDIEHPEVQGVMSYSLSPVYVVSKVEDLENIKIAKKIAVVSQTTKKIEEFEKIVSYLLERAKEIRVFNTICNATFENQEAARKLSKKADIMLIIGGKNSSNTKQLYLIAKQNCPSSYLIESEAELDKTWFEGKELCGISAGASTPDWIIEKVVASLKSYGL